MNSTLPSTVDSLRRARRCSISPGQTDDCSALADRNSRDRSAASVFAGSRLGDGLEVLDEELHRGQRLGAVEDDVPVLVEHVATERPEDRQEVRDDRVGGIPRMM